MCNWSHAGYAASHHHAHDAFALAVQAHAVRWNRRSSPMNECVDHIDELTLVNGTAAQLEVDLHMRGNCSRVVESRDVFGFCVNDRYEFLYVAKIPQRLDAACRCTGSQG